MEKPLNVLFLCTGNSARSIMAEAILNRLGGGVFRAYSAGSRPAGKVNPHTLDVLRARGHAVEGLRSKSWDEFAAPGAPPMDVVITVCDSAAREACPVWPGRPITGHWSFADPAAFEGPEEARRRRFEQTYDGLAAYIRSLLNPPPAQWTVAELQRRLQATVPPLPD